MFTALLSLFSLFPVVFTQSTFSINTPTLTQCQSSQITWTASSNPPYDLLVVSAQDVCGVALEDLGNLSSLATTWVVNLASGTEVVFSLEDAAGNEAWSGVATVGNSNDSSCLDSTTSTPAVSGTLLSASGGIATPSPTSSYAPAGVANAGQSPSSGAISTRPLSAVTLFSFSVLAVLAFAL